MICERLKNTFKKYKGQKSAYLAVFCFSFGLLFYNIHIGIEDTPVSTRTCFKYFFIFKEL